MFVTDGELVVSATDLVGFLHCEHLAWLERMVADGELSRPVSDHPMLELLREQGNRHERAYLERLRADGDEVVDVSIARPPRVDGAGRTPPRPPTEGAAATRRAMERGATVIYQAALVDDSSSPTVIGYADFLRRVDAPSELGEWSYEPEDTKLSSHVSAWAVLQLCSYAEQIARIQGREPEFIHVVLGSGETVSIRLAEISAYFRAAITRFDRFLIAAPEEMPYPLPVSHCARCSWASRCAQRWRHDDHLSQVAFMRMDQVRKFERSGITTMAALAEQPEGLTVDGIGTPTVARLQRQARLQHAAIPGSPPPWEAVTDFEVGLGLSMLPAPSPGDVFYDIEGHPYAIPGGLEYLHGFATIDTGRFVFDRRWAHSISEERVAFEFLIDFFTERLKQWPALHVYHYAHYEVTALKKMAFRHGTREDELDDLLRAEVFVDLYKVVRQGVVVGVSSYSIKRLEPLYMQPREGEIGNGGSSILEYERWRNDEDQAILDEIEAYNRDDVESTWLLRTWLEERRTELIGQGVPVPRPELKDITPGEHIDVELLALRNRLLEGIDPAEIERVRSSQWLH